MMTETTTQPGAAGIASFAARVRDALNDLPAEEVDELVDGLEADLADQAADAGDGFSLPDPVAYAAELRAAAGLEPRASRKSAGLKTRVALIGDEARLQWERAMQVPLLARAAAFFISLRPVWWLVRAWVVFALIGGSLGATDVVVGVPWNLGGWMLLGALVVVSVQWGRGRWAPSTFLRALRRIVSVIAVLLLPTAAVVFEGSLESAVLAYGRPVQYEEATPGLAIDGVRVRNVFAYDLEGAPLGGVQLFTQDGTPLTTVGRGGGGLGSDEYFDCGGGPVPVPLAIPGRAGLWNVYPLQEVPAEVGCVDPEDPYRDAARAEAPFDSVAPVPQGVVEPTAGPSPAPSEGPTPAPTPAPSADASIGPSASAASSTAP